MNPDRYYLYLSDPVTPTIIESQVVNWIEVLHTRQYTFDVVFQTSVYYLLRRPGSFTSKMKEIKGRIPGKVFHAPIIRKKDPTGISQFISFISLVIILVARGRKKKAVIQTRGLMNYRLLKRIKKLKKGTKIVFEVRGAGPEEMINAMGYKDIKEVTDAAITAKYCKQQRELSRMLAMADAITCVSTKLQKWVNASTSNRFENKIHVIPGAADQNLFYFSRELRDETRKLMGFNNRLVLIYTGALRNHYHKK